MKEMVSDGKRIGVLQCSEMKLRHPATATLLYVQWSRGTRLATTTDVSGLCSHSTPLGVGLVWQASIVQGGVYYCAFLNVHSFPK